MIYLWFIYPISLLFMSHSMWIGSIGWIGMNYVIFRCNIKRIGRGIFYIFPFIVIYMVSAIVSKIRIDLFFILRFIILGQLGVIFSLWIENGVGIENRLLRFIIVYTNYAFVNIKNIASSFKNKNYSFLNKIKYSIEYLTWIIKVESEIISYLPPLFGIQRKKTFSLVWGSIICLLFSVGEYLWLMF